MELINQYIISLVTTIIFITAVEIISPDNSTKKYINFTLGLILVAVLVTPIIKILTSGEVEIQRQIDRFTEKNNNRVSQEDYLKQTEKRDEIFINNLNRNTEKILKDNFSNMNFKTDIKCNMNYETMTYKIENVSIGVSDKSIVSISPIIIGKTTDVSAKEDEVSKKDEIKKFLAKELKISEEKINLYKLGG